MQQVAAVDARSELDLRIGAAFTRFQTLKLQKRFSELANQLVSFGLFTLLRHYSAVNLALTFSNLTGTCQFPTLGFVVDRWKRVNNFVPEDFWKIDVAIRRDNITAKFNWSRGHLFDQQFALVLYERCVDDPMATVLSVDRRPKSKW